MFRLRLLSISAIVLLSLLLKPAQVKAQTYFPPLLSNTWDTISPQEIGFCPAGIDSLYDYLDRKNSKAFILLHDGKIVLEKYFDRFTRDSTWYWASAAKSLTATMIGFAAQENRLSIQDTSSKYLGRGWTSLNPQQEDQIKIVHQLSMTTGLDDNIPNINSDCTDPACLQFLANPNTRWAYHNAPYTILDKVIEEATGQTLNAYISSKLRNTIGFTGAFTRVGYNNVFISRPRSMARFGLLMYAKGRWENNQILDSNWINQMWTPSQNLNQSYGFLWWLNGKPSHMVPQVRLVINGPLMRSAPQDVNAAIGKNGQLLNISRSNKLIFVRMGEDPDTSTLVPTTFNNEVWQYLYRAQCSLNLPEQTAEEITLYPNPAKDWVQVQGLSEGTSIQIFDQTGKLKFATNQSRFSVAQFPVGVYYLQAKNKRFLFLKE